MRVRVVINHPINQDAVAFSVFGYDVDEKGETRHYQGYPDMHYQGIPNQGNLVQESDVIYQDGWLWVPRNLGDEVEPSIVFPGTWDAGGNGIEQAIRHFTGVDGLKVSAALALGRRHEDQLDSLEHKNSELINRIENLENQIAELRNNQGL